MKILLHICCSNCALYPVKILREEKHDFTGFWYNPNIHPHDEYTSRINSVKLLSQKWDIDMIFREEFTPVDFFRPLNIEDTALIEEICSNIPDNLDIPPFPERCKSCYLLRLEKTAEHAAKEGFDAFSTTLMISPYQDFEQIAHTGESLAEKYNIPFHLKDYRPYFRDAMSLSKDLGLYRQKYCGCAFSREERKKSKIQKR